MRKNGFVLKKSPHDLKGPLVEGDGCCPHFGVRVNTSLNILSCAYELGNAERFLG